MNHAATVPETLTDEQLFQLQLKVARRADAIAQAGATVGGPWRCWNQAESEILAFECGPVLVASQQASA